MKPDSNSCPIRRAHGPACSSMNGGKPAGQEALLAAAEKSGPIQLAAADKLGDVGDQTGRKEATKNVMKVFRRSPIGVILQILMNADSKLPIEPTDKERSTEADAKQKERRVPKTVLPPDDIPRQIPPFPGEPPKDLVENREEYPVDEDAGKPTIHVNPIPELKKPEIETFPDHSKLREAFIIMESRGTPEGQVKDAQEIIDRVLKRAKERGIRVTLTHGGFQPSFDPDNPGEKMKERVFQRWPKENLGSRRSDIEFTVEDGEIKFSDNINVVTTLVDGITANSDERKASAGAVLA